MREVPPPTRPRVQTRVDRTQASYLTAHSVLRAVSETRGSLRPATGRHPRAHVVCALPHNDKVAFYMPSLRCRQASQSNAAEQYTQSVRSTTGDGSYVSHRRTMGRGGSRGETHREDVHGCSHGNLEKLVLARLGIYSLISPRNLHCETQSMSDLDRAISASTCRVKQPAICREVQLCTKGPRTRP